MAGTIITTFFSESHPHSAKRKLKLQGNERDSPSSLFYTTLSWKIVLLCGRAIMVLVGLGIKGKGSEGYRRWGMGEGGKRGKEKNLTLTFREAPPGR